MPSATPSPNQKDVTTPTPDEIEDIVPGATDHQLWLLGAQAFYQQKLATAQKTGDQKTGDQKTGDQAAIDHADLNITGLNERIDVSLLAEGVYAGFDALTNPNYSAKHDPGYDQLR